MKRTKIASEGKDPSEPSSGWNSERDCQSLVQRLGYTLPIDVQKMDHVCDLPNSPVATYHIRPEDWLKYWLENDPKILGGFSGNAPDNFEAFWKLYKQSHGTHKVFDVHGNHLSHVVPILIHGDEGRAVKKTNYLVMSIESPLGSLRDARVETECFLDRAKDHLCFGVFKGAV